MPKGDADPGPAPSGEPGRPVEYAVLCGPEDASAVWLADRLARRGLVVRLVTTEELVYSASLTHTVTRTGTTVAVRLADGAVLGPGLRGTINRVVRIPRAHLVATPEPDRDYVLFELQAVLTSLLFALPGTVVGRADPRGLCGAWWRPAEWMVAAGRAGLTGVGYRTGGADESTGRRTLLVTAGRVLATDGLQVPGDVTDGCLALAARHGGGLLGLNFAVTALGWAFESATPWPDLRPGGDALVDTLHDVLLARDPVPA